MILKKEEVEKKMDVELKMLGALAVLVVWVATALMIFGS